MPKVKLNSAAVLELPFPETGQVIWYDASMAGFGLRASPGKRSYICEARVHGKTRRVTIGSSAVFTYEKAKKEAQKLLGQMAGDVDPNAVKAEAKAKTIKLKDAWIDYLAARTLKPSTRAEYERMFTNYFSDWDTKELATISPAMCSKRFTTLTEKNGKGAANGAFRVFRAVYNFNRAATATASGEYVLPECPVKRLSETKSWHKLERRQGHLGQGDMGAWFKAIQSLSSDRHQGHADTLRDYLEILIRTGLRRNEAAGLHWSNVNMAAKTFTVTDTKNGKDLTLPMSTQIEAIFERRRAVSTEGFTFASNSKTGRLVDPGNSYLRSGRNPKLPLVSMIYDELLPQRRSGWTYPIMS